MPRRKRVKSSPSHPSVQSAIKKHKTESDIDSDGSFESLDVAEPANEPISMATCTKFSKEDIKEVADALMKDFKAALIIELKVELKAVIQIETSKLKTEITELKIENKNLKDALKDTNMALDELDQYGRRMCLEVSNVPGDTGSFNEDVEKKVIFLCETNKVDLSPAEIDKCHRLGRYNPDFDKNRRIIVKFATSKARQRIYDARKSLGDGIYVQEHLTRFRGQLGFEARKLVRTHQLAKTWVAGCKIYATMNYQGKDVNVHIKDLDDINLIKDGKLPVPVPFPTPPKPVIA